MEAVRQQSDKERLFFFIQYSWGGFIMEWPIHPWQMSQVFCVRSAAISMVDRFLKCDFLELVENLRSDALAVVNVNAKNIPALIEPRVYRKVLPGNLHVIYISLLNHGLQTRKMMLRNDHRHFPNVCIRLLQDKPRLLMKGGGFILLYEAWESAMWMPRIHQFIKAVQKQEKIWEIKIQSCFFLRPNTSPTIRERFITLGHDCYFVARLDDKGRLCALEKEHCRDSGKPGPPRQVYTDIFQPPLKWTMLTAGMHYQAPPGSWVIVGDSGVLPMDFNTVARQLSFMIKTAA